MCLFAAGTLGMSAAGAAMANVSLLQAGLQYSGQKQEHAAAQAKFGAAKELGGQGLMLNLNALRERQAQETQAAAQEIFDVSKSAAQARATAAVAAGEGGAAGGSITQFLDEFTKSELAFSVTSTRIQDQRAFAFDTQAEALRLNLQQQILQAQPTIAKPSFGGFLLQAGLGALGAAAKYPAIAPASPVGPPSPLAQNQLWGTPINTMWDGMS